MTTELRAPSQAKLPPALAKEEREVPGSAGRSLERPPLLRNRQRRRVAHRREAAGAEPEQFVALSRIESPSLVLQLRHGLCGEIGKPGPPFRIQIAAGHRPQLRVLRGSPDVSLVELRQHPVRAARGVGPCVPQRRPELVPTGVNRTGDGERDRPKDIGRGQALRTVEVSAKDLPSARHPRGAQLGLGSRPGRATPSASTGGGLIHER